MKIKRVKDIVVPLAEKIPLQPSVGMSDRITDAIRLMAKHGLTRIAVVHNGRPVGMARLEDALKNMGLRKVSSC